MRARFGITRTDVLFSIVASVGFGAVAIATIQGASETAQTAQSFANLSLISAANGQYRNDNQEFFPITLAYKRGTGPQFTGPIETIAEWSFAGKNNNAFWANAYRGAYDVEAADRPLNAYLYPGRTFFAPPPPQTLPATHPARTQDEAFILRDPLDNVTYQRALPVPTPGFTAYNDVGTSYLWNSQWVGQIQTGVFSRNVNTGLGWLAAGTYYTPSRFVWVYDQTPNVLMNLSLGATIFNAIGDRNKGMMLYADGHAAYNDVEQRMSTPSYTLQFGN
jgi:prepilin-type processing-associated H-X9-DG protein